MRILIIIITLVIVGCATDDGIRYHVECGRVGYRCVNIPGCSAPGYAKCIVPEITLPDPDSTMEERLRRLERNQEIDEDMIIYEMMRRRH